jgi:hypothetical protein
MTGVVVVVVVVEELVAVVRIGGPIPALDAVVGSLDATTSDDEAEGCVDSENSDEGSLTGATLVPHLVLLRFFKFLFWFLVSVGEGVGAGTDASTAADTGTFVFVGDGSDGLTASHCDPGTGTRIGLVLLLLRSRTGSNAACSS